MASSFRCCRNDSNSKDSNREILRLRLNWFFIMVIAGLYAVSYTSISSSFHQFITNPRADSINSSASDGKKIEIGLGESESFYSWVITVFNVGAIIGSLLGGLLLKWVPYWHLIFSSLLLHTLGYIIYAVANSGWLVMVSKLLSGVFIGAEMTLALSYFGESNSAYKKAVEGKGKKKEKGAGRVKHTLFALHSVGVNVGYVFGPGVAVIFAQFSINQFRSIAWYNVAVGLAVMIIQIIIFRGESSFSDKLSDDNTSSNCGLVTQKDEKEDLSDKPNSRCSRIFSLSVVLFLIISRAALGFRFCVYETLFNPILSDSFGMDERDTSYFFFGLVAAQVCGTIVLLVLQRLRVSNRMMAIIGLVMTIVATLLMGDWQAIRHDRCLDASLFHHPELINNYTMRIKHSVQESTNNNISVTRAKETDSLNGDRTVSSEQCEKLNLSLSVQQHLSTTTFDIQVFPNMASHNDDDIMDYGCNEVDMCSFLEDKNYSTSLIYHINSEKQCFEQTTQYSGHQQQRPDSMTTTFICTIPKSHFTYCLLARPHSTNLADSEDVGYTREEEAYITDIHRQSVEILENRIDSVASQACHEISKDCHWNPSSSITHKHCNNCPPICRHYSNYLEFAQFTIAAALLMIAVPVARVPFTSIISDIVTPNQQGIAMGLAQALNAVARSLGPLWLDAAYEQSGKRTFLSMGLSLICYTAILIGVIVLYPKLGPPESAQYSTLDSDSDTSDSEATYETARQLESMSDSDFVP